jgi:hypothetical protein
VYLKGLLEVEGDIVFCTAFQYMRRCNALLLHQRMRLINLVVFCLSTTSLSSHCFETFLYPPLPNSWDTKAPFPKEYLFYYNLSKPALSLKNQHLISSV